MKPNTGFFLRDGGGGAPGAGGAAPPGGGGGSAPPPGGSTPPGGDPFYQPYVGKLDKDTLSWLDGKKFGDVETALRSGAEADKRARERNVIMRPDTSDPAKLGEWEGWGVLGWNPDKGAYAKGIKPPKMPNDAKHDEGLMDAFVGFAHENRIPPTQAEKLFHSMSDFVNQRLGVAASDGIKAREALDTALRKDWGPDYAKNEEIGRRAAKALGIGADDLSELEKITGSPRLLKTFHKIGTLLGEANLVGGDNFGSAITTPAAAEAELRRLEADPEFLKSRNDRRHPQHADTHAKWMRLVAIAAGEKPPR